MSIPLHKRKVPYRRLSGDSSAVSFPTQLRPFFRVSLCSEIIFFGIPWRELAEWSEKKVSHFWSTQKHWSIELAHNVTRTVEIRK